MSKSGNTYPLRRRRKASESVEVKVDIRAGKGTDYQHALRRKFFTRLVSECRRELEAENEAKK